MESKELRIGNWYQWHTEGKYYEFIVKDIDFCNGNMPDFKPIPLTEEWLVKFGFEQITYQTGEKTLCFQLNTWNITSYDNKGFEFWIADCDEYGNAIDIKYVHSLQNLYFCLTGEELVCV